MEKWLMKSYFLNSFPFDTDDDGIGQDDRKQIPSPPFAYLTVRTVPLGRTVPLVAKEQERKTYDEEHAFQPRELSR